MSGTGRFIVFEGGDGAGKSTQLARLKTVLLNDGWVVTNTAEPGGSPAGERIRSIVLDPESVLSPRAEALLYAADRANHVEYVIRPALARGDVVLSDRYVDSSIAYQGHGRRLGGNDIGELSTWATGALRPDLTIVLDINPAVGLVRAGRRRPADRIEQETHDFHQRVRAGFVHASKKDPDRYLLLDASLPAETLAGTIASHARKLLGVIQ